MTPAARCSNASTIVLAWTWTSKRHFQRNDTGQVRDDRGDRLQLAVGKPDIAVQDYRRAKVVVVTHIDMRSVVKIPMYRCMNSRNPRSRESASS